MKIIIGHIWCILIFSIPRCSITVLREHRIVVIILFLFIVFHHNPSFSVLGPNIILWHEIILKKVQVKGFRVRVILHIPIDSTWTIHKTILLVCLSHLEKIMQILNVVGGAWSPYIHCRFICVHYIIKYIKNQYRTS